MTPITDRTEELPGAKMNNTGRCVIQFVTMKEKRL